MCEGARTVRAGPNPSSGDCLDGEAGHAGDVIRLLVAPQVRRREVPGSPGTKNDFRGSVTNFVGR